MDRQVSSFACKPKKNGTNTSSRSRIQLDRLVTQQFPTIPLEEVVEVMRAKELKKRLSPFADLDLVKCRAILVEWVVQVGEAIELSNLTIHAAVASLDRLLSLRKFPKSQLQLVASCCLLIQGNLEKTYRNKFLKRMETCVIIRHCYNLCTKSPQSTQPLLSFLTLILSFVMFINISVTN